VALFHVLEKEMKWREETGRKNENYGALHKFKPIVAVGAEHPLEEEILMADYFRKIISSSFYGRRGKSVLTT